MLLNNLSIYQNLLRNSKEEESQREDKRYEVERLYSTSPIIFDYSETYQSDGAYMVDEEVSLKVKEEENVSVSSNTKEAIQSKVSRETVFAFNRCTVAKIGPDDKTRVSALSKMIEESKAAEEEESDDGADGGVPLTIYLPDYNSLSVSVKETSNFKEVISQILIAHEKQGLVPALIYTDPGMYELRIHEGDGEPDRDFPALGPEKLLSDFNLDEYCICAVEGRRRAATGGAPSTTAHSVGLAQNHATAKTLTDMSTYSSPPMVASTNNYGGGAVGRVMSAGSIPHSSSAGQLSSMNNLSAGGGRGRERDRDDASDNWGRSRNRSSSRQSYDSFQNSVSTVLVLFPDGNQVVVPFKEDTLLLHLLPKISKLKRLRLYTNEYVFSVSAADQKHLKLMSPQLDMKSPVRTIGATTLEIHNKVYMDMGKVEKSSSTSKKKKTPKKSPGKSNFTEAMANAYQEWNVVKKNKFGRKQERVFGVDGKKIYNSKRGQLRGGNQTGVQRAERNISTIVKLDILAMDPKTFRITWMDDRDVYNIEYTCETTRECTEIVAKINYTREKYK